MATRISVLLAAEALRDLPTVPSTVHTPMGAADGRRIGADVVVVPVLRAGLGMLDAVLELLPVGARRPHRAAARRDDGGRLAVLREAAARASSDSYVLMIDPMLATGGSAVAALDLLQRAGARDIRILCIVAAPEGIALVEQHFPDVRIYTPVIDQGLNDRKFIVPGLGDFGDRLYGTL